MKKPELKKLTKCIQCDEPALTLKEMDSYADEMFCDDEMRHTLCHVCITQILDWNYSRSIGWTD